MEFNLGAENINYVKIRYKDKNGYSHYVKTAIKQINGDSMLVCFKSEGQIFLDCPQEIELSFACDNGLYKTNSQLKYTQWEEPYMCFCVQTPKTTDYEQNREFFRVKLEKDLRLFYKEHGDTKEISCKSFDLSASGIKLIFPDNVELPSSVEIEIPLAKSNLLVHAHSVRFDNEDNIYKVSFQFDELSTRDTDCLSQMCIQKQLEDKRQRL